MNEEKTYDDLLNEIDTLADEIDMLKESIKDHEELMEEIERLKDTIWRLKQGNSKEDIEALKKAILNTCRILTDVTWDLEHI